jgi:hypothetical protein
VKLSEGSLVKLGENAHLELKELEPSDSLFKAALGVLQGAFRFTTAAVAKNRRRDISISVATVTAGIRGTDLWGKSSPDKQIVCLIEGKVEVGAPGGSTSCASATCRRRRKPRRSPLSCAASTAWPGRKFLPETKFRHGPQ